MSATSRKSITVAPTTADAPSGVFVIRNGKLYQIDWADFKEEFGALDLAEQELTDEQRWQVLGNLGITMSAGGYLRVVAADGTTIFNTGMNLGEPPG